MTAASKSNELPIWKVVSEFAGQKLEPRDWLVHEWIPIGQPTLLYGDGGTGKSLLALQLCAAVAFGLPWIGLPAKQGKSIYFTAEDDEAEIHRRISKICSSEGQQIESLVDMEIASMVGMDTLLVHHDKLRDVLLPTALMSHIQEKIETANPCLVVFDTLADIFAGDENQRSLSRQFISMMRTLANKHRCAVLILAHPSKTGMYERSGTSGSTGWSNSARSRIYLSRPDMENPNVRRLEHMKSNYSQIGKSLTLTWADDCFKGRPEFSEFSSSQHSKVDKIFMDILDDVTLKGIRVNAHSGSRYAPTYFAAHPLSEGITKRAFLSAMKRLELSGQIKSVKVGRSTQLQRQ